MPNRNFPNSRRLRKPSEFGTVYRQNQIRVRGQYFLILAFFRPDNAKCKHVGNGRAFTPPEVSRVGVVVSKKVSKLAVQRNRIKRLTREQFRQSHQPDGFDFVVVSQANAARVENILLLRELNYLWTKLDKKCATV